MKRTLLFLALCCLLTGCGHSATGKYVNDKDPSMVLELKSDGTFTLLRGGGGPTGKYTVEGNEVTLTAGAMAVKGTMNGDKITTASDTFTKQ